MTVPLPDSGDGSRRKRRADRRRTGRRSAARILGVAVIVALVGGIAWIAVGLLVDGDDDDDDTLGDSDEVAIDAPGPALVILSDDAGTVYGITILVPATGTIVHVPPGTLVEVASIGLTPLHEAGDDELVRDSVENLLGVRLPEVLRLGPDELAAMIVPVGSLAVVVDEPLQARNASGRVDVLVPSGPFAILPENAVDFLAAVGDGTALDRLVRHQLFWNAYLAADGIDAPIDSIAAMAGQTSARQRVLPVEAVSGVEGDEELYRVIEDDLDELLARSMPRSTEGERIRVRILNGAGVPGIAQQVQPLLIDVGARVTLSGNADRFDYAVTQIVYADDARLEDARAIRDALGVGEVVKSLNGLAVVDVTVVVGADFLAAHPGGSS